jgi:hypothetical protein
MNGTITPAGDQIQRRLTRKQENRALAADGDKSLAGSKYLWLYSEKNRDSS